MENFLPRVLSFLQKKYSMFEQSIYLAVRCVRARALCAGGGVREEFNTKWNVPTYKPAVAQLKTVKWDFLQGRQKNGKKQIRMAADL